MRSCLRWSSGIAWGSAIFFIRTDSYRELGGPPSTSSRYFLLQSRDPGLQLQGHIGFHRYAIAVSH